LGYNSITHHDGIIEFIEELREQNIKVCLGSNGSKNVIIRLLNHLNIFDLFDNIVTFDDVSHGKPKPDMFLKSMNKYNLKPNECVVVGDSVQDIEAGLKAKMNVIGLLTTTSKNELKGAHIILDSPKDLTLKLLKRFS